MSQRHSGYARKERDEYQTPAWPVQVLIPHLQRSSTAKPYQRPCKTIWEPACGEGSMVSTLAAAGFDIIATDIVQGIDFLKEPPREIDAIITNPPFNLAQEFIEHALAIAPPHCVIAMLLRTDYDHAKSRRHLFKDCPQFAMTLKLLSRIVWFEPATASPSQNHSWFAWRMDNAGKPPTIEYGP